MKILLIFAIILSMNTCHHIAGDKPPSVILKEAFFLEVKLAMEPLSKKEIYANLSIKNNSKDSILLYKVLFPFNGEIKNPVFSIFSAETYEDITYSGPSVKYLKSRDEDEDETIIPDLSRNNFFVLRPGETVSFKTNIATVYDFEKYNLGEEFKIVPVIENPYISIDYKQMFEKDSTDGIKKPVYYHISFPHNDNIDSMRLKFKLGGVLK